MCVFAEGVDKVWSSIVLALFLIARSQARGDEELPMSCWIPERVNEDSACSAGLFHGDWCTSFSLSSLDLPGLTNNKYVAFQTQSEEISTFTGSQKAFKGRTVEVSG